MRILPPFGALPLLLALVACTGAEFTTPRPAPPCGDRDGDAHPDAACGGEDCDDLDSSVWAQGDCEARCAEDPRSIGCPCSLRENPEPDVCYQGPDGTLGVGTCRAGLRACEDGRWSSCAGQVLPRSPEICDGLDDDCNGFADEHYPDGCSGGGQRQCAGPDEGCDGWGDGTEGLARTEEGYLVLEDTGLSHPWVWPSSTAEGVLYKVDVGAAEIAAAYFTGPLLRDRALGPDPAGADGPASTAVDDLGDVYVANRGIDAQGSVTHVAADESRCEDLDGDGRIDTSAGADDRLAFDGHDAWEDECIVWHGAVGAPGTVVRGLAVELRAGLDGVRERWLWVGLRGAERFVEIDAETGEPTGRGAATPGLRPEDAVADAEGTVWVVGEDEAGRFDALDPEDSFESLPLPDADALAHHVTLDERGTPWLAGSDVFVWDDAADAFEPLGLASSSGVGGIAADGAGSVWVANAGAEAFLWRIGIDDLDAVQRVDTPGLTPLAVAADFDGGLWAFGWSERAGAAIVDLDAGGAQAALDDCEGGGCLTWPLGGGDLSGRALPGGGPRGSWTGVFVCDGKYDDWLEVVFDAEVPESTRMRVWARSWFADYYREAFEWVFLGTVPDDGFELEVDISEQTREDEGTNLEVRVELESDVPGLSPTLRGVEARYECYWGMAR